MLELKNITASYHKDFPVLRGISLQVGMGEKIALLGRNGAGKTTFARSVFGLVPIISGDVEFNGTKLKQIPLERFSSLGFGYFMQGGLVFPQMTVRENMLMSSGSEDRDAFRQRLSDLGEYFPILSTDHFLSAFAGSLSGGERTQLSLAMALFRQPGFLILDEPFAGLSPANTELILKALNEYHHLSGATMILIAQDRETASAFCDHHYLIRNGSLSVTTL